MRRQAGTLEQHLAWLAAQGFRNILDCTCPYEYKGLGRLYGISCGEGWVRLLTREDCPEHGIGLH